MILEHRIGAGFRRGPGESVASHWDWLIELDDGPLRTYSTEILSLPLPAAGSAMAVRLPDHRRRYLEYEGPLSNQRGDVRRIASGPMNLVSLGADGQLLVSVDLDGSGRRVTRIEFCRREGEAFELVWQPETESSAGEQGQGGE